MSALRESCVSCGHRFSYSERVRSAKCLGLVETAVTCPSSGAVLMWSRQPLRVGISAILALIAFGVVSIVLNYHGWPALLAVIWGGICLLLIIIIFAAILMMRLEPVTRAAN